MARGFTHNTGRGDIARGKLGADDIPKRDGGMRAYSWAGGQYETLTGKYGPWISRSQSANPDVWYVQSIIHRFILSTPLARACLRHTSSCVCGCVWGSLLELHGRSFYIADPADQDCRYKMQQ